MKKTLCILTLAASILFSPAATTVTSWYGQECEGRPMANGKPFRAAALTCASWDYPLGTRLTVRRGTNVVSVLVTDRGPAKRLVAQGRRLDLSRAAFERLAPLSAGLIKVEVTK
jgi:rare lipoprotein A